MRATSLLVAVLAGVLGAACQPPAAEELTNPREILGRTIVATAGLRTATLRAELQIRDPNAPGLGPGGVSGGVLEAQIDLPRSALTARVVDGQGPELGRAIVADGRIFMSGQNGRWQALPGDAGAMLNPAGMFLGMPGAAPPDYPAILGSALVDPAIRIELVGVEDCPSGRCYRTIVEIPREAVWSLAMKLSGMDQMRGFQEPAPPAADLPTIGLAVLSDTASFRMVDLAASGTLNGVAAQLRVQLTDPNGAVSIQAPPPELVDRPDIEGILDEVGQELESGGVAEPAPAPPVPPSP